MLISLIVFTDKWPKPLLSLNLTPGLLQHHCPMSFAMELNIVCDIIAASFATLQIRSRNVSRNDLFASRSIARFWTRVCSVEGERSTIPARRWFSVQRTHLESQLITIQTDMSNCSLATLLLMGRLTLKLYDMIW